MKPLNHKNTEKKWFEFSQREQFLNIAAEIKRISNEESQKEYNKAHSAYERLLELIDLTIIDPKWQEKIDELYQLRDAIASLYIGKTTPEIPRLLYTWIMKISEHF